MTFGTARNPRSILDHAQLFSLDFIVSNGFFLLEHVHFHPNTESSIGRGPFDTVLTSQNWYEDSDKK